MGTAAAMPGVLVRMPNTVWILSSLSNFWAPAAATSGLDCASSSTSVKLYFLPPTVTPPAALISLKAMCTPSLAGRSQPECGPVRLPIRPILTLCAAAPIDAAHPSKDASASAARRLNFDFAITCLL